MTDNPFIHLPTKDALDKMHDLKTVFTKEQDNYINDFILFVVTHNTIPHFIHEVNIDCRKANKWFLENYSADVKNYHYTKRYSSSENKVEYDDIFYYLYEDLILYFDTNICRVRFLFRATPVSKVDELIKHIHRFKHKRKRDKPQIHLVVNSGNSLNTTRLNITKPKLNIIDNYNDDFGDIHNTVIKRLKRKNDKGLVLLHGKPGTGKTSYIRYLISCMNKKVIFLPPNIASQLTNPDLMSILIDNPNSVFVIEDAENIVMTREESGSSAVSALLNLSDGLLSDCLNIQIICSFNTDISRVDKALLRKGRLIASYEFKALEKHKAQKLSDKLGFEKTIHKPMLLTDVYNQDEKKFGEEKKYAPIGFGSVLQTREEKVEEPF